MSDEKIVYLPYPIHPRPSSSWSCHAVWGLNITGTPAKAHELIVGWVRCGSRHYIDIPSPEGYLCVKCWTPCREDVPDEEPPISELPAKQKRVILALQQLVQAQEWEVTSEKAVDHGQLFFIRKGNDPRVATVTCYHSGSTLIQGKDGPVKSLLQEWEKTLGTGEFTNSKSLWDQS